MTVEATVGKYDGLKDVKTLVDVGGGTGRTVKEVVKKHPHIHGVVFDLPHAVAQASHVEGNLGSTTPFHGSAVTACFHLFKTSVFALV